MIKIGVLELQGNFESHHKILKKLGYKPIFLTRGYKGLEKGPVKVRPYHNFNDVGDEALLLSKVGPTVVSANRSLGAKFIESLKNNYNVILMDDGLQMMGDG